MSKPDDKNKPATSLDRAYDRARGVAPAATTTALATLDDLDPEELGLGVFDAFASGDVKPFEPDRFKARLDKDHVMIERFLTLKPGEEVVAWLLGSSLALVPRDDGFRVLRKLHLELMSGARVSQLEAAQLRGLFRLPMDGSCEVVLVRGATLPHQGGAKQMTDWGCSFAPGKRKATHAPGKGAAQLASEAEVKATLEGLKLQDLMRIQGAPDGFLLPYIDAARDREAAAHRRATSTTSPS